MISEFITTVGFPIVCVFIMGRYIKEQQVLNNATIDKLTDHIRNIQSETNKSINGLSQMIGKLQLTLARIQGELHIEEEEVCLQAKSGTQEENRSESG